MNRHSPRSVHSAVFAAFIMAAFLLGACASPPAPSPQARTRGPSIEAVRAAFAAMPANERLETFASDAEFRGYIGRLQRVRERHQLSHQFSNGAPPVLLAAQQEENCPEDEPGCEALQEVQVTGSRITAPPSITNNQVSGVDEGDIVKSWGRFLVVLQDARLFSIDLGDKPGDARLVHRVNAYQNAAADAWYDELLIHDNHVLVTGYSYEADQTEISIFDIDALGRLTLKSRFFIKSEDYFSGGNYASRLVDGELVIYTPIDLAEVEYGGRVAFPRIRGWTPRSGYTRWQTLLTSTDIYRPVDRTLSPMIHAVSVCPAIARPAARCRSTGLVAARDREMYVSPEAAYLWIPAESADDLVWYSNRCTVPQDEAITPRAAMLYQLPFHDTAVTAVRVHGQPPDQFSLERRGATFHALVRRVDANCERETSWPLDLFSFPLQAFSDVPSKLPRARVRAMPNAGEGNLSARFAPDYLAYGAGNGWWRVWWSDRGLEDDSRRLVTVSLDHPEQTRIHKLDHSIERVELLGRNLVTFGVSPYRTFGVTTLDLRNDPAIAGSLHLSGLSESEGRSHAFNASVQEDGSAILGLPTGRRVTDRRYGRFEESVHFFNADDALRLTLAGAVPGNRLPDNTSYECEMSCIDWYGNARPIFYQGRIFALIAEEFVEAALHGGNLREVGRLDLTLQPPR